MENLRVELNKAFPRLEWDLVEFEDGDIHAESFIGVFHLEVRYRAQYDTAIGTIDVPACLGRGCIVLFRDGYLDRVSPDVVLTKLRELDWVSLGVVLHKMREYCDALRNQVEMMCAIEASSR